MADLPKDTRPDADFGELPPDQSWTPDNSNINSAANALGDSIRKGLGMMGEDSSVASDNMIQILLSVEKSMKEQTEILGKISNTLDSQLALNVENDEDADRAARLASISEEDEKSKVDPEAPKPTPLGRLKDKVAKTVMPQEDDSIMKKLAKVAALAAGTFFTAKGFFKETSSMVTEKLVEKGIMKEETAEKVDESVGKAGGISTGVGITQQILKRGSFGKLKVPGAVPLMVGSGTASLAYDAIGEMADENDEILGMRKEISQAIGGGLTGILSFVATGKAMKHLSRGMKKSMNIAKKKLGMKVPPDPEIKKAKVTDIKDAKPKTQAKTNVKTPPTSGNNALKTDPKPPKTDGPKPKAGGGKPTPKPTPTPKSNVLKFPSGANVRTDGKVIKGPQASTKPSISQAIKDIPAEKAVKYAKFLKFAGVAGAVIPALIEPILAISNDESPEVIKKEISGALGSVGGGVLGGLAGTAIGSAVPGLGNAAGLLVGAGVGALAGEYLVEKMTSYLMNENPEVTEDEVNKVIGRKKKKSPNAPSQVKARIITSTPDERQEAVDTASTNLDMATAELKQFQEEAGPMETRKIRDARNRVTGEEQVYADPEKQKQFKQLKSKKDQARYELYSAKELQNIANEQAEQEKAALGFFGFEEDMRQNEVKDVAEAQIKADETSKALADFESTAKSGRTVTEVDDFGFETTKTVFDDAKEQAQFDKLNAAKFDAENNLFDANNKLITGDEFETAGMFEKVLFLQDRGFLPEGESQIEMGKFVGGPLSGMTPDEAISMYVTQQSQIAKSASEFKAGDRSIPTIEADPTKPVTEDGKIPGKVTPAEAFLPNNVATGDDMGLSVEEAEKQLTDAKEAFAQAEEDGSIYEGFRQDQLQADIQFAEKDLRDANARAAANGDFVKRKPEAPKSIMETLGIQSAPEKLGLVSDSSSSIESSPEKLGPKAKFLSEDQATKDAQGQSAMMASINKAGDVTNNVGGSTVDNTINVFKGGNDSLSNHTPKSQTGK